MMEVLGRMTENSSGEGESARRPLREKGPIRASQEAWAWQHLRV